MDSTIAESVNAKIKMNSTLAGSMNDNININSTMAESMNDQNKHEQYNSRVNE